MQDSGKIRAIACAVIVNEDVLQLQQRDDIPGILFPGYIGLFGGHVEEGESFLEAVQREVLEETGLDLPPEKFIPLVEYQTRYPDGIGVNGSFYYIEDTKIDGAAVTEGQLLTVSFNDVDAIFGKMTPATSFVVKTFLDKESSRD